MLAQAAMLVVFVLGEKISRGTDLSVTAEKTAKASAMPSIPEKCHSDDTQLETVELERGKPHERATQTTVGALHIRN